MSEPIPFVPSDAWLLHAILLAAKDGEASLEDMVAAADAINHAMLTFDEIDGGLARLTRAGLVAVQGTRFTVTAATDQMRSRMTNLSMQKATETLRASLGIPEPVPPFRPTPADPRWRLGAFTVHDLEKAEKRYRRKFWAAYRKQDPGGSL